MILCNFDKVRLNLTLFQVLFPSKIKILNDGDDKSINILIEKTAVSFCKNVTDQQGSAIPHNKINIKEYRDNISFLKFVIRSLTDLNLYPHGFN